MSSLIVSHDLRIVMLEVAVENLFIPWTDVLDSTVMKRTIIMFRMLDDEWTTLLPNRRDYRSYRGSNYENESFYGGRSVLFSVPEAALEEKVTGVDVQFHVYKEVSKYFEMDSRQNFGFTLVKVDDLLNGIVKDLGERRELKDYMSPSLEREPISRSTRGVFPLLDEDLRQTEATIELYIRLSYLGKCVITELHRPMSIREAFYAKEDTAERYPYQFRELTMDDLQSGCWGSRTILHPVTPQDLRCRCMEYELEAARKTAEAATLTRKKRRKRGMSDYEKFLAEQARIMALIALLRAMRGKRKSGTTGLPEKTKGVCLPPLSSQPCPLPCPRVCEYPLPCDARPAACQPTCNPCPTVKCQSICSNLL